MATKTSLLGLTKPAYTDAADVNVLNTNFDLIDKAIGNGARVENLLVNSWFVNPINQRGQVSYTNGYTIDRWRLFYNNVSIVDVTSDGLKLTSVNNDCFLQQFFEKPLETGKTYTFAVKYNDGVIDVFWAKVAAESTYRQNTHCIYGLNTSSFSIVARDFPGGVVVQWAALYEGEYTADTLPTYIVPDKHVEMIRCGVPLNPLNLLDNSDFTNPINQRGIASGGTAAAWSYCIDRWLNFSDSSGTMTFTSDGIRYTFSNLNQPIPPSVKTGTVVTAAAYWSDGTLLIANGTITRGTAWTWFCSASASDGRKVGVVDNGNGSSVHFRIDGSEWTTLVWAALYEGTYTADTLPAYQPKERVVELYNCDVPLQPRNELDNSSFLINQRGATSTTSDSAYFVDRWIANSYNNLGGVRVGSGGITLTPAGNSSCDIYQRLEHYAENKGKTYTAAVCVNGVWECKTFALGGLPGGYLFGNGLMLFSVDNMDVLFRAYSNYVSTVTIQHVALYSGEYTADTLPAYQYKGYAAELAECRRYYRPKSYYNLYCYASSWLMGAPFDTPMRIQPTATVVSVYTTNWNKVEGETTVAMRTQCDGINSVQNANFVTGGYYRIELEFSADL